MILVFRLYSIGLVQRCCIGFVPWILTFGSHFAWAVTPCPYHRLAERLFDPAQIAQLKTAPSSKWKDPALLKQIVEGHPIEQIVLITHLRPQHKKPILDWLQNNRNLESVPRVALMQEGWALGDEDFLNAISYVHYGFQGMLGDLLVNATHVHVMGETTRCLSETVKGVIAQYRINSQSELHLYIHVDKWFVVLDITQLSSMLKENERFRTPYQSTLLHDAKVLTGLESLQLSVPSSGDSPIDSVFKATLDNGKSVFVHFRANDPLPSPRGQ